MTAPRRARHVEIWHNVLWSRYKGRVFSALHRLAQARDQDVRFVQMAETESGRLALGPVDLDYHRYPFELLYHGPIDRVPRWRSVPLFFWRGLTSRADFVVIAGYAAPQDWAQLIGLILSATPRGVFCDSTLGESKPGFWRGVAKRLFFRRADLIFCYGERAWTMALHFGARPRTLVRRCQAAALPDDYDATAVPALRRASKYPRFLYVGRLAPEKNLDRLLSAFGRFRAVQSAAELRLVGDGPLRDRLGDREGVTFVGGLNQDQLASEYLAATALILPSLREPWGLVVNEALAYGCPVLVSDQCGCVPELVRTGETGLSFDAYDEDALLAGMRQLMADPPSPETCLAAIAEFTPEAAAGNILDGIDSHFASRRAGSNAKPATPIH